MTQLEPGVSAETPARALAPRDHMGVRVLAPTDVGYADGFEATLLSIVRNAPDVSSLAGSSISPRNDWAVRYHLTAARANCLRSLRLDRSARVLEVGAGCGAVTRWLGEQCAVVDALEPQASRAAVARERCRDLPGVEVFQGLLQHVPAEPTYDVIFVIGVLEYVGHGSLDDAPYVEFLSQVRARLRPGGAMVLAIENKLGVKYVAGAPEDHSGRLFHGVEGYHGGGPARTFDRVHLTELAAEAGFGRTDVKSLFPDYKMTRVVLDDRLFSDPVAGPLACRLPSFPSSAAGQETVRVMSERHLWQSLVEAEVAPTFANSFLLLASEAGTALWPAEVLASFASTERHPAFATLTEVIGDDDGIRFDRRRLGVDDVSAIEALCADVAGAAGADPAGVGMRHQAEGSAFVPGIPVVELVAQADERTIAHVLAGWERLVHDACRRATEVPIDLIPRNVILDESGALRAIDQEWFTSRHSERDLLGRGLLYLAMDVSETVHPYRFPGSTVGELVVYFASMTSLARDLTWLSGAVEADAALQAFARTGVTSGPAFDAIVEQSVLAWARLLERRLVDGPLGTRQVNAASAHVMGAPVPLRAGPAVGR